MADEPSRPSADPIQLTDETTVKDPDNPGATITYAPGTVLSAATAKRVGLKPAKTAKP